MDHYPQETTINGVKAKWSKEIDDKWAEVVKIHFKDEKRPCSDANYFTPRPYVDQYNRGSDSEGFVYVVGIDVCYHTLRGSFPWVSRVPH